jgi:hypothetical protein
VGNINYAAMAAAVATTVTVNTAIAAKKCDIKGTFTDTLGSSGKFTSEKKGTGSNSAACPDPYKLKVTDLTQSVLDFSGTTKDKSCGSLTGTFTFVGGCTTAEGTLTVQGLGSFGDAHARWQSQLPRAG